MAREHQTKCWQLIMDGALEAADATPRRTTFDKICFLLQMQIEILKISFKSTRRKTLYCMYRVWFGCRSALSNGTLWLGAFGAAQYRSDVHAAVYRCRAASTAGTILSRDMRLEADVAAAADRSPRDVPRACGHGRHTSTARVLLCTTTLFVQILVLRITPSSL
ncbi:hypothetical protein SFRURICE_017773 [Spodoptera frugiperda]|uniref:SFRICE_023203 n=1 Tax=Spodoptera frugiperda TaxID=7108 RepID=A0A2H1VY71_SPOFR|nr:hypothetical protein SFRURICE_017773 [Spodoptera frugiperda]